MACYWGYNLWSVDCGCIIRHSYNSITVQVCKIYIVFQTEYYRHVVIFQLLVSCALSLCVIAFSYIMTTHHLVKSSWSISEGTQNPRLNKRKNTAKILLGLTVIFLISYLPFHIIEVYYYSSTNFEFSSWKFYVVFNRDFNFQKYQFDSEHSAFN